MCTLIYYNCVVLPLKLLKHPLNLTFFFFFFFFFETNLQGSICFEDGKICTF